MHHHTPKAAIRPQSRIEYASALFLGVIALISLAKLLAGEWALM